MANGTKINKKLAKITQAKLEIKELGILNFWIFVEYEEGGQQGIGGIALDTYDKIKNKRVGAAGGCELIRQLLLCLRVDDFSEMSGKMLWVLGDGNGFGFTPIGIESLKVDGVSRKVIFKEIFDEFKNE